MAFYDTNASFNSHAFLEQFDGGLSPAEGDVILAETDHHIPGSDDNVTNSLGRKSQQADIAIRCTASVLASLQGDVDGNTHSLVWHVGTTTALLLGVLQPRKQSGRDVYEAVLRVRY